MREVRDKRWLAAPLGSRLQPGTIHAGLKMSKRPHETLQNHIQEVIGVLEAR